MSNPPAFMPEDAEAQLLLDAYLADLQAGRPPDRRKVLAVRPDLASMLACLEHLDRLSGPTPDPDATLSGPLSGLGRRVGKYDIERELGRGGMGVVYLAHDRDLKRPVALKMILSGYLADPDHQRRFQNEVRSAARLDHEGTVRIYDTGEAHGLTYLAMQYIEGPSLGQILQAGRLERTTAVRCAIQLARTVHDLHAQGIVHRDLKPSNILILQSGAPADANVSREISPSQLKITDFGLAKLLDDASAATTSGMVVGTPSYMAPEQARGESGKVGPAADVYALGAVLYEMLTGRPPFAGETALAVLLQVMGNEPPPLRRFDPEIPRDLEFICLKCLEKSPSQRYASAAELADALERHLKGEETSTPGLTAWQSLRRWTLRAPGLAARIGILALCCIVLSIRALHSGDFAFSRTFAQIQLPHVLATLGIWIALSALFQRLLRTDYGARYVPFLWSFVEVLILTTLLVLTDSLASPIDIGYPLLIAGSGLWLRRRVVWFTTSCAVAAYAVATAIHFLGGEGTQFHRHVIFVVGLLVTGYVVSYQVRRFRLLSRFYEGRAMD